MRRAKERRAEKRRGATRVTSPPPPPQSGEASRTFVHIASEVGAYEAEEVGVEHLLRDINDPSVSSTAGELRHKLAGLRGLRTHLGEVIGYLDAVTAGRLPANRDILYHVQTLLARLPNTQLPAVVAGTYETVNDQHLVIYMAALTRSVLALHDLLANKQKFKAAEEDEAGARAAKEAAAKDAAAAAKAAAAAAGGEKEKKDAAADKGDKDKPEGDGGKKPGA